MNGNIPSKYQDIPNEELVILSLLGDNCAYEYLFKTFQVKFFFFCRFVCPYANAFDESDLEFITLMTFVTCVTSFRLGRGSFSRFFLLCLKQNLSKESKRIVFPHGQKSPLSLEGAMESHGMALSDCITSAYNHDDPTAYLEYYELLKKLNKLPKYLSKRTGALVSLIIDGYSIIEASKKLGIPYRTCKEMYRRYKQWAITVARREM